MSRCRRLTKWGRCQQPAGTGAEQCTYHTRRSEDGDSYYERKVVLGLVQPVEDYLTDVEIGATLGGRKHEDGRRLDAYCLD